MEDLKRLDKLEKDLMFIANIRDVIHEVTCQDVPERDVEVKPQSLNHPSRPEGIPEHQSVLDDERSRRKELEESAKLVAVQLQKTEDELERMRETKRVLLMGTLELKNQMQGYECEITQSRMEISRMKEEKKALEESRGQAVLERQKLEKDKKSRLEEMQLLQQRLKEYEQFKSKWECLSRDCFEKDKCVKEIEERLQETLGRNEALLKEKRISEEELRNLKIKMDEERTTKEQEMTTRLIQEQQRLEAESSKTSRIVLRAKDLLLKVQKDKEKLKEALEQSRTKLTGERQTWKRIEKELHSRLKSLEKQLSRKEVNVKEQVRLDQEEKRRLETSVKRLEFERASLENRIASLDDLISLKDREKEDEVAKERQEVVRLKGELERVKDNLGILQKVSEDQVKTIRKQRGELEETKEEELRREREAACRERELKLIVDEESTERRRFRDIASRLEEQLLSLQADVKSHNCEDEVDVIWRGRVERLEKELQSLEKQRDSAVDSARKAVEGAREIKRRCEAKCESTKSELLEKITQLEKEKTKVGQDMTKKVQELETEVTRLRQLGEQVQETYGAKVAHLQGIIQACFSGGQTFLGSTGQVTFGKGQASVANNIGCQSFPNGSLTGITPMPPNFNIGMGFP